MLQNDASGIGKALAQGSRGNGVRNETPKLTHKRKNSLGRTEN